MSGTVVEVLARLKADAGNFVRGTAAARRAARELAREANRTSRALDEMGREATQNAVQVTAAGAAIRANAAEARALGGVYRDLSGRLREANGRFADMKVHGEQASGVLADLRKNTDGASSSMGMLRGRTMLVGGALVGLVAYGPSVIAYLQQLTGLVALIPALAGAAAVGIGALVIGLNGFGKAMAASGDPAKFAEALKNLAPAAQEAARELASLAPVFRGFRNLVQQSLFEGMAANFRAVANVLLPGIVGGFQRVAGAISRTATALTRFWTSTRGLSIWNGLLAGTASMIDRMRPGLVALTAAMGTLASSGASMLGGIGGGFTAAMQRFDAFVQRVAADGSLHRFIQGGLDAFGTLMSVLKSLGMIVGAITSAFRGASQAVGGGFAEATRKFAVFLNSAQGQQALIRLFNEMGRMVRTVGKALQALAFTATLFAPLIVALSRVAEWLLKHKTYAKWLATAFTLLWVAALGPLGLVIAGLTVVAAGLHYGYTHSRTFRDGVDKLVIGFLSFGSKAAGVASTLIRVWAGYLRFMVDNVFGPLLHAAEAAFGWLPGIGDQVKAASAAFDTLSTGIIKGLDLAADAAASLGEELDWAARERTLVINIRRIEEGRAEDGLAPKTGLNPALRGKPKPSPTTKPTKIPGVGGSGFGAGPKAAPTKALPPMLASIPVVSNAAALAAAARAIGAAMAAAGKAITLHFQSPLEKAVASLQAAKAASAQAVAAFTRQANASRTADAKAAQARAAYLKAHKATVAALKASGGEVTDTVKAMIRAEQVAKQAAQAAASAATKAGNQAKAAAKAAMDAAQAVQEAQQAIAQAKYDVQAKAARSAFDKIAAQVEKIRAKYDALTGSFAQGVKSLVDLSKVWGEMGKATESSNGLGALKDAISLADELGVSMNRIIDQAKGASDAVGAAALTPVQQTQKMLDDALAQSQRFLAALEQARAAGASQSLLQQITDLGPVAGAALAEGLVAAGDEAVKQMNATVAGLDAISTSGVKGLAEKVFGPELNATQQALNALSAQFKDVFGEIADDVAALTGTILGLSGGKKGDKRGGKKGRRGGWGSGLADAPQPARTFSGTGPVKIDLGGVSITVPATAAGVTPEDVKEAVADGIAAALQQILSEMAVR